MNPVIASNSSKLTNLYFIPITMLLFGIGLVIRLINLDVIDQEVFDEVHYIKFAESYLSGLTVNDGHPPLGKYLIMLGIIILGHNFWGYRIFTALFGALITLQIIGLSWNISKDKTTALISGTLFVSSGIFIVDSRFALTNIFLVSTGLSSLIFYISGINSTEQNRHKLIKFICSGCLLGASAAVKWSGLGYWLTILVLTIIGLISKRVYKDKTGNLSKLINISKIEIFLLLIVAPVLFYILVWIPHIILNPIESFSGLPNLDYFLYCFWEFQKNIVRINTSSNVLDHSHPYISPPLCWIFLARPVGFFFKQVDSLFIVVQELGNPILWWSSTASVVMLIVRLLYQLSLPRVIIIVGFLSNYLPWFLVKRDLFVYHYMPSLLFALLSLSLIISETVADRKWQSYLVVTLLVSTIIASMIFFMPIWLGLPLTPEQFYQRMWIKDGLFNWI